MPVSEMVVCGTSCGYMLSLQWKNCVDCPATEHQCTLISAREDGRQLQVVTHLSTNRAQRNVTS